MKCKFANLSLLRSTSSHCFGTRLQTSPTSIEKTSRSIGVFLTSRLQIKTRTELKSISWARYFRCLNSSNGTSSVSYSVVRLYYLPDSLKRFKANCIVVNIQPHSRWSCPASCSVIEIFCPQDSWYKVISQRMEKCFGNIFNLHKKPLRNAK